MAVSGTSGTITISAAAAGVSSGAPYVRPDRTRHIPTNALTVAVYARGSTTPITDPAGDLRAGRVTVESYETLWPGGLYGQAALRVQRDVTRAWQVAGGQRVVIRNGLAVVYEGFIPQIGYGVGQGAEQYRRIQAAGATGQIMSAWGINKMWADNRLTEDVWVKQTGNAGDEKHTVDRLGRIRFTPKAVAQVSGEVCRIRYTAPTGQTVKRVTCSYGLAEGANQYTLRMVDNVGASVLWSVTATGTGTQDVTLGTPRQVIDLEFYASGSFTPSADGTEYGQVSSVVVYTETGSINLTEIAKDVRAIVTDLNSDETQVGSNTLSLVPFITSGRETAAAILSRAAQAGDSSYNSWYWDLLESDAATTPNGGPVLRVAQYPALTDYDYAVRLDDPLLDGALEIVKDFDGIRNWIVVRYRSETGADTYITPDDDANLTDATSVAAYGHREIVLDAGQVSSTIATNYARRYLAAYKDPRFYVSGAVTVRGWINAKNGQRIPASEIKAGKRLRVLNFLADESGVSGAGMTWHVTRTQYNDAGQTCAISTGVPDDLAVFIARLMAGKL
jgi:hypothetical protein